MKTGYTPNNVNRDEPVIVEYALGSTMFAGIFDNVNSFEKFLVFECDRLKCNSNIQWMEQLSDKAYWLLKEKINQ